MKRYNMEKAFVHRIPPQIEEGVLYICLDCNVIIHKCACGCGEKVVLPLAPDHWQLYYDGEVTLSPSIGNYQYTCKSHYFIRNSKVVWVDSEVKNKVHKKKKRKKKKIPFLRFF